MWHRIGQVAAACGAAAALVGILVIGCATSSGGSGAEPSGTLVSVTSEGATFELDPGRIRSGVAEAELCALDGTLLAKGARRHSGRPVMLALAAALDEKDLAAYYLRYRFSADDPFEQRSLYYMSEILETTVLGQRELVAGTKPVVRVLVRDRAAGRPVTGAAVTVALAHEGAQLAVFEAKTDGRGEVAALLDLPNREVAGAQLTVDVKSRTAAETVTETVTVKSATQTLLTTDKPLYQPGQTIHIRALSLARPSMVPLTKADVVFEVEDSKGNKVFKKRVQTDDFGVSFADFVLADELNKGEYRVRAVVAGAKEEKTVTVERYVLPKFKIAFTTDRQFYQPGETVKAEVQVDYFFGKPVAGGAVRVTCAKFDVAYQDFQTIDGKTDAKGHYAFDVKLPAHFVGQPLEQGKASAKFQIEVTDTADHKETLVRNVSVTAAPIIVAAVPESGDLVPDLENRIYVVTTYADATPAACEVTWTNAPGGKPIAVKTDAAGFGQLVLTPQAGQAVNLELVAKDAKGHTGKATVALQAKQKTDDSVLLRTDKALYRVGQPVMLSVVSTKKAGSVYVDVIKDRQTFLTRTLDLKDGKAADELVLDATLAGTVQINAYLIGANGVIVRDRRLVIVDPADDLSVKVASDSETYLPGGEAKVTFSVTNKAGRGTAAALGVIVVDEAVFALQEMQPGLEKVYFYLEKEIATPRYEIHGWSLEMTMPKDLPTPAAADTREAAAKVLLASAKGVGDYSIHVNTYQKQDKGEAFLAKMVQHMQGRYTRVQEALQKFSAAAQKDTKARSEKAISLDDLVKADYLKAEDTTDSWGGEMKIAGYWCTSCQNFHGFVLESAGIDGKWGTADDVTQQALTKGDKKAEGPWGGVRMMRLGAVADALPMPMAPVEVMEGAAPAGGDTGGGGAPEPPRIRRFFPETLLFKPAVITDRSGRATLAIPLADSITTWRMTCMASSARGQLGSTTAGIRVFQDFFVDIDFPVALTQNDQVSVPVVVYNYLKTDQAVRLKVQEEPWFTLKGAAETTLKLGPSEVKAVYFPIVAKKVGFQTFTVFGYGAEKSDAIARSVEIVPDGKEFLTSFSGRLEKDVSHTVTIPEGAIEGANGLFVKVYPGMLSQVVEGLDKMLRMPFGCFEQTSSVTYPNILVLDYMKTTGKITPELQMKAEGFINAGYQRLLSFEVQGGGFEWFGNAPAHRILTAYGLMEFHDMSKVHEVDPNVITRTQQWLAKLQEEDGAWKPSKGGIAEGAINKFTDDVFRNTAYISWALASTGYQGPEVRKGLAYLEKHLDEMQDTYTIALAANAFGTVDPKGKATIAVLNTLLGKRKEEGDLVWWPATSETATHGTGNVADIEVTGLAVQAFVRCGRELGTVSKAVSYLAKSKDAYGTWQSTQATIQALRAMLMAERGATQKANATIEVVLNGESVKTLTVDESNSDVLQLVDLKDRAKPGDHAVALRIKGEGALLYQIVGRYYLPYPREVVRGDEPISITVDYDRTQLATEDVIAVTATVTNNRPGSAKMVIVDLGLPPGFTLIPDELNAAVKDGRIQKYTTTGRQIIVYLDELVGGRPLKIAYALMAKYPLRAQTSKSAAYEYYNPAVRGEAKPIELVVAEPNPKGLRSPKAGANRRGDID